MAKKIIDTAFELADAKFKKNNFSFKELFDLIKNEPNANVDNEAFVANFYTQLLSSPDFLMIDNQRWVIKKYLTSNEIAEYSNTHYAFGNEEEVVSQKNSDVNASDIDESEEESSESDVEEKE